MRVNDSFMVGQRAPPLAVVDTRPYRDPTVTRIVELVAGLRSALSGEDQRLDRTMRLSAAVVFTLLVIVITVLFFIAAMVIGAPDPD
jgi:hypothetical protein